MWIFNGNVTELGDIGTSSSRHQPHHKRPASESDQRASNRGRERETRDWRPASPPTTLRHTRDGDAAAAEPEPEHKSAKDLSLSSPLVLTRVAVCRLREQVLSSSIHPSIRPPSRFLRPVGGGCRSAYPPPAGELSLTWSAGWSGRPRRRQRHAPPPPPPPPPLPPPRSAAARSALISST